MKLVPKFTQLPLTITQLLIITFLKHLTSTYPFLVKKVFFVSYKVYSSNCFYINFKTKLAEYVRTLYVKNLSIICQYISALLFVINSKL